MFCCRVDDYLMHDFLSLIIGFDLVVNMYDNILAHTDIKKYKKIN